MEEENKETVEVLNHLWSWKTALRISIHCMLVMLLFYIGALAYVLAGMTIASVCAAYLLRTRNNMKENLETVCKGFIYLTMKTILFSLVFLLVLWFEQ